MSTSPQLKKLVVVRYVLAQNLLNPRSVSSGGSSYIVLIPYMISVPKNSQKNMCIKTSSMDIARARWMISHWFVTSIKLLVIGRVDWASLLENSRSSGRNFEYDTRRNIIGGSNRVHVPPQYISRYSKMKPAELTLLPSTEYRPVPPHAEVAMNAAFTKPIPGERSNKIPPNSIVHSVSQAATTLK